MARSFADYQVLRNGDFTLDSSTTDRDERLFFDMPHEWHIRDDSRRPILAFQVAVTKAAQLKVKVNTHEILNWGLALGFTRGLWCPFEASVAWPGGQAPDPAPVDFFLSEGKVRIEKVVMWYQVEE